MLNTVFFVTFNLPLPPSQRVQLLNEKKMFLRVEPFLEGFCRQKGPAAEATEK